MLRNNDAHKVIVSVDGSSTDANPKLTTLIKE